MRTKTLIALLLLCFSALLTLALTFSTPTPRSTQTEHRLLPSDLLYKGAFAYPVGDEWAYSGHALTYYPSGDPAGSTDGYPGSLYAVGHAHQQLVGEITIPVPVIADNFDALPRTTVLQPLRDITGGWLANCTYAEGCEYKEVAGLEYLDNLDRIAWNLRDWYNAAAFDQDSLGWSDLAMSNAQGVWHIGERLNPTYNNARTNDYLFKAPQAFADQYLGGKWLIAGNAREAGALGGSQGPTLYATAPWADGTPPAAGADVAAVALLYYPEVIACVQNDFAQCYYPDYRADDSWSGGAWIDVGGKRAVVLLGRKGLGNSCYGIPGEDCPPSLCNNDKGWRADPYEPQMLFYDPDELALVATGARQPWEPIPYAIHRPINELLRPDCGILNAVAYDPERRRLYATESQGGPFGETVVHVWEVQISGDNATPTPIPPTATPQPTTTPTDRLFLPWVQAGQ